MAIWFLSRVVLKLKVKSTRCQCDEIMGCFISAVHFHSLFLCENDWNVADTHPADTPTSMFTPSHMHVARPACVTDVWIFACVCVTFELLVLHRFSWSLYSLLFSVLIQPLRAASEETFTGVWVMVDKKEVFFHSLLINYCQQDKNLTNI